MNVAACQIRRRDEQGALTYAGFKWAEPIVSREKWEMRIGIGATVAALLPMPVFLMWHKMGFPPIKHTLDYFWLVPFVCGWIVLPLLFIFFRRINSWSTQDAAVAFSAEGNIWVSAPRGFFQRRGFYNWYGLHLKIDDIDSIEREACANNGGGHYRHGGEDGYLAYAVVIHFSSGERRRVAEILDDDDSFIVVRQLNLALNEVRNTLALAA